MKYTKLPSDAFKQIQLNAGVLLSSFNPSTGAISLADIIGATSGGINFNATPTYEDFGSDIDNCPKNTKELKKQTEIEITIAGTFVTTNPNNVQRLIGAADVDSLNANHIVPRLDLKQADFVDLWWVGDYSDQNGNSNGGFVAIHMKNTLSTGGFQIQSNDKAKGTFSFTFTAHFSLQAQEEVPYEVYVKSGTAESGGYAMDILSVAGTTTGYTAITTEVSAGANQSYVYQTGLHLYVPNEGDTLVGTAWTAWDGDDEISSTTGLDIVVAIIDAENKAVHAGRTIVTVKES